MLCVPEYLAHNLRKVKDSGDCNYWLVGCWTHLTGDFRMRARFLQGCGFVGSEIPSPWLHRINQRVTRDHPREVIQGFGKIFYGTELLLESGGF